MIVSRSPDWESGLRRGWTSALRIDPAVFPLIAQRLPRQLPEAVHRGPVRLLFQRSFRSPWREAGLAIGRAAFGADRNPGAAEIAALSLPAEAPSIYLPSSGVTGVSSIGPRTTLLSQCAAPANGHESALPRLVCRGEHALTIAREPGLAWGRVVWTDNEDLVRVLASSGHPAVHLVPPGELPAETPLPEFDTRVRTRSRFLQAAEFGSFCWEILTPASCDPTRVDSIAGWFGATSGLDTVFIHRAREADRIRIRLVAPVLEHGLEWETQGEGSDLRDPRGAIHWGFPVHLRSLPAFLEWLFPNTSLHHT